MRKVLANILPILAILGLLALFGRSLWETGLICWEEEDYSHGLLLPLIGGYFIWTEREKFLTALSKRPPGNSISFLGVVLLVFGILVHLAGNIGEILFISWFAFFPSLMGVIFLFFGAQPAMHLAGPLLLLFMAKPLPDALVPKLFFPLQVVAAKASAWVLDALHVPVYLMGNIIEIPGMRLMVEEACSGLRSLMALLTVAWVVMLSINANLWMKIAILILSVLIAILLNIVRVAATGVLAHFYDPAAASGFFHTFSGMVVFVVGLVILYSAGSLMTRLSSKKES